MIRGLKRDMETQKKKISSRNITIASRKRAREELMLLKSSLNRIENKKLERAKESAQTQFLNERERCSKYLFALNKPKEPNNI